MKKKHGLISSNMKLDDTFGMTYRQHKGKIVDAIKRRNSSISGGHGTIPLGEEDYFFVKSRLKGFIMQVIGEYELDIEIRQMPVTGIMSKKYLQIHRGYRHYAAAELNII